MLTLTTKSLLDPISDAIAQFTLVIAHAELNDAAIPDLREVAGVVADQVLALAEAGRSLVQPEAFSDAPDQHESIQAIQTKLDAAVSIAQTSAQQLKSVSEELGHSPRSKQGRDGLIRATQGILSGTRDILDAYDDSEIQRIILFCQKTIHLALECRAPALAAQEELRRIKSFRQSAMFCYNLAFQRVSELFFPGVQQCLQEAVGLFEIACLEFLATLRCRAVASATSTSAAKIQDCVLHQAHLIESACNEIKLHVQQTNDYERNKLNEPILPIAQSHPSARTQGSTLLDLEQLHNDLDTELHQVLSLSGDRDRSTLRARLPSICSKLSKGKTGLSTSKQLHHMIHMVENAESSEDDIKMACESLKSALSVSMMQQRGQIALEAITALDRVSNSKDTKRALGTFVRETKLGEEAAKAGLKLALDDVSKTLRNMGVPNLAQRMDLLGNAMLDTARVYAHAIKSKESEHAVQATQECFAYVTQVWEKEVARAKEVLTSKMPTEAVLVAAGMLKWESHLENHSIMKLSHGRIPCLIVVTQMNAQIKESQSNMKPKAKSNVPPGPRSDVQSELRQLGHSPFPGTLLSTLVVAAQEGEPVKPEEFLETVKKVEAALNESGNGELSKAFHTQAHLLLDSCHQLSQETRDGVTLHGVEEAQIKVDDQLNAWQAICDSISNHMGKSSEQGWDINIFVFHYLYFCIC
jgi:hypothetical protein